MLLEKDRNAWAALWLIEIIGAPGKIRTPNLLIRSQVLYPVELRARRSPRDRCLAVRHGNIFAGDPFQSGSCNQATAYSQWQSGWEGACLMRRRDRRYRNRRRSERQDRSAAKTNWRGPANKGNFAVKPS